MKLRIKVENKSYDVDVEVLDAGELNRPVAAPVATAAPAAPAPAPAAAPAPAPAPAGPGGGNEVKSPIAGTILSIAVQPGDSVNVNDTLLVLEAMKMESNVAAPAAGVIADIAVKAGDSVQAGQILVTLQ
jgi:biotin carboxyl carrier protein